MTELMTAEQLERGDIPGKWTELVRGDLVVREPPGTHHGQIAANLLLLVGQFAKVNGLGRVFSQDTGFKIGSEPDTVRAPDLAFIRQDRLKAVGTRGYAAVAPDLIAEVLSPDDRAADVLEKIADWLAAGVDLAWVVDPEHRQVRVHRADGTLALLSADDRLEGELTLPGFSCPVREIFE